MTMRGRKNDNNNNNNNNNNNDDEHYIDAYEMIAEVGRHNETDHHPDGRADGEDAESSHLHERRLWQGYGGEIMAN